MFTEILFNNSFECPCNDWCWIDPWENHQILSPKETPLDWENFINPFKSGILEHSDVICVIVLCGWQANMATRKPLHSSHSFDTECSEGGRELFEACRNGDVTKVRRIVNINSNVNLRDTAGRKSSPLHFAAGKRIRWKQTNGALIISTSLKESQSFCSFADDLIDFFWIEVICYVKFRDLREACVILNAVRM